MMDDTSWGSGIEQLAIMFVRFGLNPNIVAWEQAMRRVLLSPADRQALLHRHRRARAAPRHDEGPGRILLKAFAGNPWLVQNEVRDEAGYADRGRRKAQGPGRRQAGQGER
jgi:phage portal protein BeeE